MLRRIGASLLTMLLLAGCAGVPAGGGSPSAAPSAVASPSAVPSPSATPAPTASPVAPLGPTANPALAWPTTPGLTPDPVGAPLLQDIRWGDTGPDFQALAILQDGRIVITRWEDSSARLLVRKLTPSGLDFVRAAIAKVGLFDKTQSRPVVNPPACCGAGEALWFTTDGATTKVSRQLYPPDAYAPSAAWDRFDALVKAMANPETWIPASGWVAGSWQPYRAASYCLTLSRDVLVNDAPLDGSQFDWSGILPFSTFGKPAWEGATTERAGTITATRANALALEIGQAANAAGIPVTGRYDVPFDQGGTMLVIGTIRVPDEAKPLVLRLEADPPFFTTCP